MAGARLLKTLTHKTCARRISSLAASLQTLCPHQAQNAWPIRAAASLMIFKPKRSLVGLQPCSACPMRSSACSMAFSSPTRTEPYAQSLASQPSSASECTATRPWVGRSMTLVQARWATYAARMLTLSLVSPVPVSRPVSSGAT